MSVLRDPLLGGLPGLLEETEAILRFVVEELGTDCYVNLIGQYNVSGKVGRDGLRRVEAIATLWRSPRSVGGPMEIGEPERTYTVEPLEDPVPRERPEEPAEQPAGPSPAEEPVEPEKVRTP